MRNILSPTLALAALSLLASSPAFAAEHVEAGKVDCDLSAGIGVIVGSQQEVSCVFTPSGSGPKEDYKGKITEFGIDIGEIGKAKMAWLVYAPASRSKNALAGTYSGVSADAAVGLGLGAKVLVGGDHGTISLQPVSVQAEEGVNIAAGITALTLDAAN
ncbi:DUF992 domain-containing protein (plasmid) [Rhizobium sp. CC1099]|uniref:DUF992 domain-containing protein n=1 Tax=Rhizobium sp. CC1099 TaxID=3039160 RepID=UPI0024B0FDBD|nr:DUF992 domain-containing protein [Rhizobium sp. CC1099]WFU91394.1 DUF992 domain-containing protein [Rhizobium sp. CC1099]